VQAGDGRGADMLRVGAGREGRKGLIRRGVALSIALVMGVASINAWAADTGKDDDEARRVRQAYFLSEVIDLTTRAAEPTHAEAAMKAYLAESAKGAITPEGMKRIYQAAGGDAHAFKVVATLIDKGLDPATIVDTAYFKDRLPKDGNLKISGEHSLRMAGQRDLWIEEVIREVAMKHKPPLEVARSDSGNIKSGMKSDLDQTFFVFEVDKQGQRKRNPELDGAFIKQFEETWSRMHPDLPIAALDVSSIQGRDKFPDPRVVSENFSAEFRRTADALRRTPGAYTFQGATVQQMQFRVLAELYKNNPRAYQVYGLDAQGNWVKRDLDVDEAIRRMFDDIKPELLPAHAFGASLANYVEILKYRHKDKFQVKYHLRTVEDGMWPLLMREKARDDKVELGDLDEASRRVIENTVVDKLFNDPEKIRRHKMAMEISVALRLQHKNEADKIKWFESGVPADTKRQHEVILSELARDLFGDTFNAGAPDPEHIKAAEGMYRDLATEFCLESAYHSSVEAMKIMNDGRFKEPFDFSQYQHLVPDLAMPDGPAKLRQLQEAAHITFLYGIYDLGLFKSLALIKRLHTQFGNEKGIKLQLLQLWARGQVQGIEGALRDPAGAYNDLKQALGDNAAKVERFMREGAPVLGDRVQRHIEAELGFQRVNAAHEVGAKLGEYKLQWRGRDYIKERALDPGNIDALAQVLRAYVESKGDWERTKGQMVNEFIMAIPIGGQLYAASQSDWKGLVLMAGAMQFPVLGVGLLAYSVGEAGYAIYDVEVGQPLASNIENAIYRGYAGPDTRAYEAPPQFTEKDQDTLERLRYRRDFLKKTLDEYERWMIAAPPPGGMPDLKPRRDEIAAIQDKINVLETKKAAFERFRDDPAYGGYFTGGGAVEQQRKMPAGLLDDIELVIGYSPAGLVDFATGFDAQADPARLQDLARRIKATRDVEELIRLGAEYDELDLRKARYERAQRYRAKATGQGNDVTAMTESEAKSSSPELLHKLRRDSLYPGMLKLALAQRVEKGRLAQANTDTYVDEWLAKHGQATVDQLVGMGLIAPDRVDAKTGLITRARIPDDIIENLKNRLQADLTRSREMTRQYEEQEKRRKEADAIRARTRVSQYHGQAFGAFLERVDDDPQLADLAKVLEAMRIAAVKRHAPVVKATVYMTKNRDTLQARIVQAKKQGADQPATASPDPKAKGADTTYDFTVAVQVEADPTLYYPPYKASVIVLDLDQAKSAAVTGRAAGLDAPLLPDTQDALKRVLREKISRSAAKDEVLIPLVSVHASGMPDLSRALPATVNHLPGVDVKSVPATPTPQGAVERRYYAKAPAPATDTPSVDSTEPIYLMGQAIAYTVAPGKTGDLRLVTRRQKNRSGTDVLVTSKALAGLDDKGGKVLVQNLYLADDPEGDFKKILSWRGVPGKAGIEPEAYPDETGANLWKSFLPRRIAKDVVLFPVGAATARPPRVDGGELTLDTYKPLYFMVGEQWSLDGQLGDETFSDPSELGPAVVVVGDARRVPFDATEAKGFYSSIYGYYSSGLGLGLRDQDYQYMGAHFTVQSGDWQGHSWSYRRDTTREYGQGGGELVAPGNPEPITVRISAERGDTHATRQITLSADDAAKHRQGQARAIENLRAQYGAKIGQNQNQLANTATTLADKQAQLKKAIDNPKYVYGANNQKRQDYRPIYDLKLEVSNTQFSQRRLGEITIPFLQADLQGRVAFESGQWQAAYTALSNALNLQRAAITLNNERLADIATIQDWYFTQPAPRDEDAAGIADLQKRAVAARPGNARSALRQSLEERQPIVSLLLLSAKWTGQMANVKNALAEKQELADGYAAIAVVDAEKPMVQARQRREQEGKAREARLTQRTNLREEADATALLTGDRDKAASLYAQGMDLYADEFKETGFGQPAKPWRDETSFPAWWPENGEGGKPSPPP
jgi:hypothetical protein